MKNKIIAAIISFGIIGSMFYIGFITKSRETTIKPQTNFSSEVKQSTYHKQIIEERIVNLPEDSGKYWLTLFLPKNPIGNDETSILLSWFETHSGLNHIASNTRNWTLDEQNPYYKSKYGHREDLSPDKFPILTLQMPDGKICYKVSSGNFPKSANQLYEEIAESIERCFPRPKPKPDIKPVPKPQPQPIVNPLPDIRPKQTVTDDFPAGFFAVMGFLGLTIGVVRNFIQEH